MTGIHTNKHEAQDENNESSYIIMQHTACSLFSVSLLKQTSFFHQCLSNIRIRNPTSSCHFGAERVQWLFSSRRIVCRQSAGRSRASERTYRYRTPQPPAAGSSFPPRPAGLCPPRGKNARACLHSIPRTLNVCVWGRQPPHHNKAERMQTLLQRNGRVREPAGAGSIGVSAVRL